MLNAPAPLTRPSVQSITLAAPAKVNLALHVTGRRADGYHLLESLVVFTQAGDRITVEPADTDQFRMSGRFGRNLPDDQANIVIRARDALRQRFAGFTSPVAIHLEKNLPLASGIGGGSSDAAATLRALCRLWNIPSDPAELNSIGLKLGADLPMCLHGQPLIARGIGEQLEALDAFPRLPMVLVNNGIEISTPQVFSAMRKRDNPALPAPQISTLDGICDYLGSTRNDLFKPVCDTVSPDILSVIGLLRATSPRFVQMSGSGGTCFAVYTSDDDAQAAADAISARQPQWYVAATSSLPAGGLPHGWN